MLSNIKGGLVFVEAESGRYIFHGFIVEQIFIRIDGDDGHGLYWSFVGSIIDIMEDVYAFPALELDETLLNEFLKDCYKYIKQLYFYREITADDKPHLPPNFAQMKAKTTPPNLSEIDEFIDEAYDSDLYNECQVKKNRRIALEKLKDGIL